MQSARFNVIPAVGAVNDIETFRTHMMKSEKPLHRKLELRINDCITWRMQLNVPLGHREEYMAAFEVAFSASGIIYFDFHANLMNSYHHNFGKEFKKRAFLSVTKDNKHIKRMQACCEHSKAVSRQREGLWRKFVARNYKWYIYDDHHKKANVVGESIQGLIMGSHVKDTDWIKLSDGTGYVRMWGWEYQNPTDGTGLVYTSVV